MKQWSRTAGLAIALTAASGIASPEAVPPQELAKWLKDIIAKDATARRNALIGFTRCDVDCRASIPKLVELYPKAASPVERESLMDAIIAIVNSMESRYSLDAQLAKKPAARIGPEAECRRVASVMTPVVSKPPSDAELQAWMGTSELLARCGTAAEVPVFVELLKASELFVRASAAEGLGRIGPDAKDAIPALEALAKAARPGGIQDKYQRAIDRIRRKP
jgi:hypothetical protein